MKVYPVDIKGFKAELPILPLPSGISIVLLLWSESNAPSSNCVPQKAQ